MDVESCVTHSNECVAKCAALGQRALCASDMCKGTSLSTDASAVDEIDEPTDRLGIQVVGRLVEH